MTWKSHDTLIIHNKLLIAEQHKIMHAGNNKLDFEKHSTDILTSKEGQGGLAINYVFNTTLELEN